MDVNINPFFWGFKTIHSPLTWLSTQLRGRLECRALHVLNDKEATSGAPGLTTRSKDATRNGIATRSKKLLGAPGLTTRNKKQLGATGIATRSKDATRSKRHRY